MPSTSPDKIGALTRSYSRYAKEALALLGQLIRSNRIERRQSVADLATRVGISRDMMRRIELGDPRCGIGSVFEAAAIVGVELFESDRDRLVVHRAALDAKLRLLPKSVHKPCGKLKDDF